MRFIWLRSSNASFLSTLNSSNDIFRHLILYRNEKKNAFVNLLFSCDSQFYPFILIIFLFSFSMWMSIYKGLVKKSIGKKNLLNINLQRSCSKEIKCSLKLHWKVEIISHHIGIYVRFCWLMVNNEQFTGEMTLFLVQTDIFVLVENRNNATS